jgi:hypothetical protein
MFVVPAPAEYPVDIWANAYKDDDDLKGSSFAMFDGSSIYDVSCDPVVCITGAYVVDDSLQIMFRVNGWKSDGTFDSNSRFEVLVGGVQYYADLHTSCSQILYTDYPYAGVGGTLYILCGDGTCLRVYDEDCPETDKILWFMGTFNIPCDVPANLTFNVYKDQNDLKGTSTAFFDGVNLTDVICDPVACITGASDALQVDWYAHGWKDEIGKFETNTRFELIVDGCGTFYLDLHTSCSQDIYLGDPYALMPEGTLILTDGCGGENCLPQEPVAVEESTWGAVKALYR